MMGFDHEIAEPVFPPLMRGEGTGGSPFPLAVKRAREGTGPGLIVHRVTAEHLAAAIILAPEQILEDAIAVLFAVANGFADAFGALAPSEVSCHFDWPGGIRINGARCGRIRAAASTRNLAEIPDWLVVAIDIPFVGVSLDEPGQMPDRTTLVEEGCAEIDPVRLLESWSRHMLVWIHTLLEDGPSRLYTDWAGRAFHVGENISLDLHGETYRGIFLGLDEKGSMVLKSDEQTHLLPMTMILEDI